MYKNHGIRCTQIVEHRPRVRCYALQYWISGTSRQTTRCRLRYSAENEPDTENETEMFKESNYTGTRRRNEGPQHGTKHSQHEWKTTENTNQKPLRSLKCAPAQTLRNKRPMREKSPHRFFLENSTWIRNPETRQPRTVWIRTKMGRKNNTR